MLANSPIMCWNPCPACSWAWFADWEWRIEALVSDLGPVWDVSCYTWVLLMRKYLSDLRYKSMWQLINSHEDICNGTLTSPEQTSNENMFRKICHGRPRPDLKTLNNELWHQKMLQECRFPLRCSALDDGCCKCQVQTVMSHLRNESIYV